MRALAFILVLASAACRPGDPEKPRTWVRRLDDPDPHIRVRSVRELRRLRARDAAPKVAALLRDPLVKEEAALALVELGGPGEVPALLDAVDTTVGAESNAATRAANRTNLRIAEALGNIGDGSAGPVLLRLARASDESVRMAAVEALGKVRSKEAIPELSHIVDDPAAPPSLVKRAILALGQIGDPSAVPALIHGLVSERRGVSFVPESSLSLVRIGESAVEPLLRIAQDQDAAYLAWAKENSRSAAGTYARTALALGELGDRRAVPVLMQKLKYVDPDPAPGTSRLLTALVREQAARALGRMRVHEAAAAIQSLVSTREPQDEELAAIASRALVWIGDPARARELLKKAQSGAMLPRVAIAEAAGLLGDAAISRDLTAIAQREMKAKPEACAGAATDLDLMQRGGREACEAVAGKFTAALAPLAAASACSTQTTCWVVRLQDKDALVRERAAYELGRSGAGEAVQPLLKACSDEGPRVREAAMLALEWLSAAPANKDALHAAAGPLSQLSGEPPNPDYARVNDELRQLQIKLSRL